MSQDTLVSNPRKPWQFNAAFAVLGAVAATASYLFLVIDDRFWGRIDFAFWVVSVIFCPPQLLLLMCPDCDYRSWELLIAFAIFGVLNAALYTAIGNWIFRRRRAATVTPEHR